MPAFADLIRGVSRTSAVSVARVSRGW